MGFFYTPCHTLFSAVKFGDFAHPYAAGHKSARTNLIPHWHLLQRLESVEDYLTPQSPQNASTIGIANGNEKIHHASTPALGLQKRLIINFSLNLKLVSDSWSQQTVECPIEEW